MLTTNRLLLLAGIACSLLIMGCSTPGVLIMPRVGSLDIDGKLKFESGALTSSADDSDLDLDEDSVFQPRVDLNWEDLHISASGTWAEYSGTGTVNRSLSFGGNTINFGTPVHTELDLNLYTLNLVYDVLPNEFVELGLGGGAGYVAYDADIRATAGTNRIETDEDMPFIFLAARVAKEIDPLFFLAYIHGASWNSGDEDLAYYEIDALATVRVFRHEGTEGRILGGYRWIDLDYEYDYRSSTTELNGTFQGPYIGFMISF